MAQDRKLTFKRLTELWNDKSIRILETNNNKFVILSDLHFGDGGPADDFRHNTKAIRRLLSHYLENNYRIILLGDIEELWQFDLDMIKKRYDTEIYSLFRKFGVDRIIRVFGNHDREWESPRDPVMKNPDITKGAPEALKMKIGDNPFILLVHGHQGNIESDKNSWISKFLVRGAFKPLEPLAKFFKLYGHPSATKSQVTTDYEQVMYAWAKKNEVILICGHSHRAIFASTSYARRLQNQIEALRQKNQTHTNDPDLLKENKKKIKELNKKLKDEKKKNRDIDPTDPSQAPLPCYFNTGCGLFTTGITCLEIENDEIRLVKWHKEKKEEPFFEIYERGKLSEFLKQIKGV
ncbi:MAG: metallophosphoesterase family protein [Candidatus Celaenobacter antarcticus]|nr:metallophosphoesterase family protein [Candidatus Celaenobacter antarcticus]MDP8315234.1 metallophosphoesterase family protein [Candidatus Celaenobacter antarcticus]